MHRRRLLGRMLAISALAKLIGLPTSDGTAQGARLQTRSRPGDPGWPAEESWEALNRAVGGRLIKVQSPLATCLRDGASAECEQLFKSLKNPYFLGDDVALTQSMGWVDAWTSSPSVFAVAARSAADVVATVNFARTHRLRLLVKGGGHSYQGTSNAPDSLLIWTRGMNAITPHDAFVGAGCAGHNDPQPAVSIEPGAIWGQVYQAVTTRAGRYVQGGGCLTVGVAGLVQSGGFGSFSKAYGTAAASLLEAEVVTADGGLRTVNACSNPDLFWALKGGGGGSLGVVTRLTLRTHALPHFFGATVLSIKATSDAAFRRLIGRIVGFYAEALFNPHWGEQIGFRPDNVLVVAMVHQGLSQQQAETIWRPFLDWIAGATGDYTLLSGPLMVSVPAGDFWNPAVLGNLPGVVVTDPRQGASPANIYYAANVGEAGQVLHAYQSLWLPASLLRREQQDGFADALFAASRHWSVTLHVNKGLAGAGAEAIAAAKETATNPVMLEAFALLISAAQGAPAYPGIRGHEPNLANAHRQIGAVRSAVGEIERLLSQRGSYLAESDFFETAWQQAFWGSNYPRLLAVKDKYDPDGLFIVHHGVGSERWSADGFTRLGT
ncbi:MAG TPA: FAD-binding oxidoreductase [Hyphomicrobiaceae bacterium]|nr:FAD-binding oxidoreductase [Hyphomicrobiaceae bacterium]